MAFRGACVDLVVHMVPARLRRTTTGLLQRLASSDEFDRVRKNSVISKSWFSLF